MTISINHYDGPDDFSSAALPSPVQLNLPIEVAREIAPESVVEVTVRIVGGP